MTVRPTIFEFEHALQNTITHAMLTTHSGRLVEALRYVLFPGGKRFRPQLMYALGDQIKVPHHLITPSAIAIELIHNYSLIHDDLPAMDNDTMRRGQPTCHIAFDEATAILTGDALHSLAFDVLANHPDLSDTSKVKLISALAQAVGASGMIDGQMADINPNRQATERHLINQKKTGCLIEAATQMVCIVATQAKPNDLKLAQAYGHNAGLLFQCHDDLIDADQVDQITAQQECAQMLAKLDTCSQRFTSKSNIFDAFHNQWRTTIVNTLKKTSACS
jgi:farnesyl diphosphate synthase